MMAGLVEGAVLRWKDDFFKAQEFGNMVFGWAKVHRADTTIIMATTLEGTVVQRRV